MDTGLQLIMFTVAWIPLSIAYIVVGVVGFQLLNVEKIKNSSHIQNLLKVSLKKWLRQGEELLWWGRCRKIPNYIQIKWFIILLIGFLGTTGLGLAVTYAHPTKELYGAFAGLVYIFLGTFLAAVWLPISINHCYRKMVYAVTNERLLATDGRGIVSLALSSIKEVWVDDSPSSPIGSLLFSAPIEARVLEGHNSWKVGHSKKINGFVCFRSKTKRTDFRKGEFSKIESPHKVRRIILGAQFRLTKRLGKKPAAAAGC